MLFDGASCALPHDWQAERRKQLKQLAAQEQQHQAQLEQQVSECLHICCESYATEPSISATVTNQPAPVHQLLD